MSYAERIRLQQRFAILEDQITFLARRIDEVSEKIEKAFPRIKKDAEPKPSEAN